MHEWKTCLMHGSTNIEWGKEEIIIITIKISYNAVFIEENKFNTRFYLNPLAFE